MKASLYEALGSTAFHVTLMHAYGKRFVIYTVIPDRMSSEKFAALIKMTDCLGKASYREAVKYGYLRYFEIAIDVLWKHTSAYFFHLAGAHTSKHIHSGNQDGGSHYSGSVKSSTQLCAYDKSEQLISAGLPAPFDGILRIEVRLRRQRLMCADLGTLENPLPRCWVCPRDALAAIELPHTKQSDWLLFQKRCAANGVANALRAAPDYLVPEFRNLLKKNQTPWWPPETVWQAFGATALKQLQGSSNN